jgi:hypothetical protein
MTGGLRSDVLCSFSLYTWKIGWTRWRLGGSWIVVERSCRVAGADGVEVRVDGNGGSDAVEESGRREKGVRQVCCSRSPFDGVLGTPDPS